MDPLCGQCAGEFGRRLCAQIPQRIDWTPGEGRGGHHFVTVPPAGLGDRRAFWGDWDWDVGGGGGLAEYPTEQMAIPSLCLSGLQTVAVT